MPLVFDQYPGGGRKSLGTARGSNCRAEYGAEFMRITGQTKCAYCGTDLTASYEVWLTMALDHVVPTSICKIMDIDRAWCDDYSNMVLACAACNGFCNRYNTIPETGRIESPGDLYDLRNRIFLDRKLKIEARHVSERKLFAKRPWERPCGASDAIFAKHPDVRLDAGINDCDSHAGCRSQ
jgi:hypothetical protein